MFFTISTLAILLMIAIAGLFAALFAMRGKLPVNNKGVKNARRK